MQSLDASSAASVEPKTGEGTLGLSEPTQIVDGTTIFPDTLWFAQSAFFSPSGKFSLIASFIVSSSFLRSVGEGPNHASGRFGTSAAVGTGLGGLSALAALAALLLLLFLKKEKNNLEAAEEEAEKTLSDTQTEDENIYISQYGLSDRVRPMSDGGDHDDIPRTVAKGEECHCDIVNASEHSPDELDNRALELNKA
jgi:hypothetical protein